MTATTLERNILRMFAFAAVMVGTLSAGLAALLADQRNREPGWFAVGGLLLGPIGILIAAFAATGDSLEQNRLDTIEAAKARSRAVPWTDADGL